MDTQILSFPSNWQRKTFKLFNSINLSIVWSDACTEYWCISNVHLLGRGEKAERKKAELLHQSKIITHTEHPKGQADLQSHVLFVYTILKLRYEKDNIMSTNRCDGHSANQMCISRVHSQLQKQLKPPSHSCHIQLLHLHLPSFIASYYMLGDS